MRPLGMMSGVLNFPGSYLTPSPRAKHSMCVKDGDPM
eukprot:CAMPEP_0206280852 /NCGR_PEP_ID=MMETSP0047_2-20121206/38804_1 /ASSEMBLY_ACC=CAM_ASM_000192 /TAXON_ID=195065 /ORGANISM="Chroomonas mesostigmatica_cf, Strain CCMP1168" /LENGTH=36 /DNA_ID= /DNA_START= /DNA_END= /DNA_ORIENTATION=